MYSHSLLPDRASPHILVPLMPLQEEPLTPDLFHGNPNRFLWLTSFSGKTIPILDVFLPFSYALSLMEKLQFPESLFRNLLTKNVSYQNTNKEIGKISSKITNLLQQLSLVPKFNEHIVFLYQEIWGGLFQSHHPAPWEVSFRASRYLVNFRPNTLWHVLDETRLNTGKHRIQLSMQETPVY